MSTPEEVLIEEDGFYKYTAVYGFLKDGDNKKLTFRLSLPGYEDNIGWFNVEFPDGRKYTIYDFEELVDFYVKNRGTEEDVIDDIDYEENEFILLKKELLETIKQHVDEDTAKKVTNDIWDNYKIEPPS